MATSDAAAEQTAATTVTEPAAGGFVGRFGLDPWLLLAQTVNFLIVLVVLSRFVFRPLLATLRARTARIDQGLKDAAAAKAERERAAAETAAALRAAGQEASATLRAAENQAHRLREDLVRRAEADAAAIHDRAERDASQLKTDALRAATADVGELAVDVATAVLQEKLTDRERAAYRAAALKRLHARSA